MHPLWGDMCLNINYVSNTLILVNNSVWCIFLCSGIVPRVIKVAPACAIMISSYEFGKAFFRRRNATLDAAAAADQ